VGRSEPLTDAFLEVVPPLVAGVDAPEAHPERELGQGLGAVFLPGGAVEEIGNGMMRWCRVILPQLLPGFGHIAHGNELSASLRCRIWRRMFLVDGFTAVD
jgi:hypothetical protein